MNRLMLGIPFVLLAVVVWFAGSEAVDLVRRDGFACEAQGYLDVTERKIVAATLEWACREDRLEQYDRESFADRFAAFKPVPHKKWYRGGGDWVAFHYDIRSAVHGRARRRTEKKFGCDAVRMQPGLERPFLPPDWVQREQLYEAHFRISRHWDRPSRPLAHLRTEYRELKEKLEECMRQLGIE